MLRSVMAFGCLLAFSVAVGADEGDKKGKRGDAKKRPDPAMMFKKLDANGDGKISKEEFAKIADLRKGQGGDGDKAKEMMGKLFDKLDADGNGSLSEAEMKKMAELRQGLEGRKKKKNDQ